MILPSSSFSYVLTTRLHFLVYRSQPPFLVSPMLQSWNSRPTYDEVIEDYEPEREEKRRELQSRRKALSKKRTKSQLDVPSNPSAQTAIGISGDPLF